MSNNNQPEKIEKARTDFPANIALFLTAVVVILGNNHCCYLESAILDWLIPIIVISGAYFWTLRAVSKSEAWKRAIASVAFAVIIQLFYLSWLHSPLFPDFLLSSRAKELRSKFYEKMEKIKRAESKNEPNARNAQMDKLILEIHKDLKNLSRQDNWLSTYCDKCLYENRMIFYMPKWKQTEGGVPAMPDQISIGYIPVGFKSRGKFINNLDKETSCFFSSLNSKVFAGIILRNAKDSKLEKKIKQLILFRCKILHRDLKKQE